jgi:hypothetical protein
VALRLRDIDAQGFWHINFMISVYIVAEIGNINFKIDWILIW